GALPISPEALVGPALDDAEERSAAFSFPVGVEAAEEPAQREVERALRARWSGGVGQALVEGMDDVGTERMLDLDAGLRGEESQGGVHVGTGLDPVLAGLSGPGEASGRKGSRIGQERGGP